MSYDDWKSTEPDYLDPGRLRTDEDRDEDFAPTCDTCGCTIAIGCVSLAGVGLFCSHPCADLGAAKHARLMAGRRG